MGILALSVGGCSGSVEVVGSEGARDGDLAGSHNPLCDAPEPQGTLACTSLADDGDACRSSCDDSVGTTYESDCHGQACTCSVFGAVTCSCSFDDPGAHCGNVHRSCCPSPWP